jgi:hypothetical protein
MRNLIKNKKGMSVGDIYPIVLTVALAAILIAIVLYLLATLQPALVGTNGGTTTNEFGTGATGIGTVFINTSGYTLSNASLGLCAFKVTSLTAINLSSVIPAANYSLNPTTGLVMNTTLTSYQNVSFNYSYVGGGQACSSLQTINTSLSGFVPWIGIILLIVAASIVLGILIRSLGGGGAEKRV